MGTLVERTERVLRGPVTAAARRTVPDCPCWRGKTCSQCTDEAHSTFNCESCTPATPYIPDPATAWARALVDGVPSVQGEACGCCFGSGAHEDFGKSSDCDACHGTGRIGARQALPGLLAKKVTKQRCCKCGHAKFMHGHISSLIDVECDGLTNKRPDGRGTQCGCNQYREVVTEVDHGVVLAPLLRQALEAGEYGAAIGQVRQRVYGIHTSINGIPTDPTKKGYEALLNAIERAAQEA